MEVVHLGLVDSDLGSSLGWWAILQVPTAQQAGGTYMQVNPTQVRDHHGHPVFTQILATECKSNKLMQVTQEVPEETCDLQPEKVCKHVTKMVPV